MGVDAMLRFETMQQPASGFLVSARKAGNMVRARRASQLDSSATDMLLLPTLDELGSGDGVRLRRNFRGVNRSGLDMRQVHARFGDEVVSVDERAIGQGEEDDGSADDLPSHSQES